MLLGSKDLGFAKLVVWSTSSPSPPPFCAPSSSSCASNCGEYSPLLISPDARTRYRATLIWPAASGTGGSSSESESDVKKSSLPDNASTGSSLLSPYRRTPFRDELARAESSSSSLPFASLLFLLFFSSRCFLRSIRAATSFPSRSSPLSHRSKPTSLNKNSRSARPPPSDAGTLTHLEFTHVSSPRLSNVATSSFARPSK